MSYPSCRTNHVAPIMSCRSSRADHHAPPSGAPIAVPALLEIYQRPCVWRAARRTAPTHGPDAWGTHHPRGPTSHGARLTGARLTGARLRARPGGRLTRLAHRGEP